MSTEVSSSPIPFYDFTLGQWVNYHGHIADMTVSEAVRFAPNEQAKQIIRTRVLLGSKPGTALMEVLDEHYNPHANA